MAYLIPQGCTVSIENTISPGGRGISTVVTEGKKYVKKNLGNIEEKETKRIDKGTIEVNKVK
jgi:hypothetical protein